MSSNSTHDWADAPVASPCIGVCQLDAGDICLGCGRSLQDIADWSMADETQRRQILERAQARQQKEREA